MRRTWLVTGATGFLGRHLIRELIRRGDSVRALVRSTPVPELGGIELHSGDVLLEESLDQAIEGCDGVFHLAGRVAREATRDQIEALHVDGTANVLRAMARTGVRRMVLASTSGTVAVSKAATVHDDSAPFARDVVADWPYYTSKIHAEELARGMAKRLDLEVVTLRPSLLLGPEDFGHSSTDDVRRLLAGEIPFVPRGGLSFVDVRDAARTFANAMDRASAGEAYLLGGANMTLRDFFGLVANIGDVAPPAVELGSRAMKLGRGLLRAATSAGLVERIDPVSLAMAEHYWYCDWTRAVADLDHQTRSPAETIEDTVAWLQAYGEVPQLDVPGKLLRLPLR